MSVDPFVYILLLLTTGGEGRNITFLLGTTEGVSIFNTGEIDSFDTIYTNLSVMSVDYHLQKNMVYFFCDGSLYKSTLVPVSVPAVFKTFVVAKMSHCRGFAVDWVHNVIYWVDCNLYSLKMMHLEGKDVITIIGNLGHRKTVKRMEVDPHVGKVFWIADGTLEWSDLTGDNYQTNISQPGVYVTSFTLDIQTGRLFYIGTTSLNTNIFQFQYILEETNDVITRPGSPQMGEVYGLIVLSNYLYWVNNEIYREVIYRQNLNMTGKPEKIFTINRYVWHMKIVEPEIQTPLSWDPCRLTTCSHFCVHQRGVHRCLCPDLCLCGPCYKHDLCRQGAKVIGWCLLLVLLVVVLTATLYYLVHIRRQPSTPVIVNNTLSILKVLCWCLLLVLLVVILTATLYYLVHIRRHTSTPGYSESIEL